MRITLQTIGTRGDIQPFVALGAGLQKAGFGVSLATSPQFEQFVKSHGLAFAPLPGDIIDFIQTPLGKAVLSGRNKLIAGFRLLRQLTPMFQRLADAQWEAAQGANAIVYHPKAIAGVHIAEKLEIPAFVALPLPALSPTGAFPSPLLPFPDLGWLNHASHWLVTEFGDLAFRKVLRRWRHEKLGLAGYPNWLTLRGKPVPRLYPYSSAVVPVPSDWDASSVVTGYWFVDDNLDWQPPASLTTFLDAGPAPIYVGFGSLPSLDALKMTSLVLEAVARSGQRAVLARGWGGLEDRPVPPNVHLIDEAPHGWLFPRVSAVVHHGGAGTTAAGLKEGRPTIICPFIGDQPFWGERVRALGVGPAPIRQRNLTASRLASALATVEADPGIRERAAALGKKLSSEQGVANAVRYISDALSRTTP